MKLNESIAAIKEVNKTNNILNCRRDRATFPVTEYFEWDDLEIGIGVV